MDRIRPIAIYLPQYHPIPENDEWWGKGFTEWRNVVKAKPRYRGHYQPHLPADLGFYDLRIPEIREQQARLAQGHGVYGFCYYHYWFNGKEILERPFQEVYESGKPDFPFMLCWANENWTRAWDGSEREVLLEQKYSEEDDRNHIRSLIHYFKDKRYIKVGNKPVFCFYKTDLIPDIKQTVKIFREEARIEGLDLYLCQFERWIDKDLSTPEEKGLDGAVDFQPLSRSLMKYRKENNRPIISSIRGLLRRVVKKFFGKYVRNTKIDSSIINYGKFVDFDSRQAYPAYKWFPGICPSWDNSSRRVNHEASIFDKSTPAKFGEWVNKKVANFKPYSEDENFVFINAWNEWAEGNHMEPCEKWGKGYLEALKDNL